jgi:hypothetical protein
LRQRFVAHAYALIPLGLAAWIAFSISFVFANASYISQAASDPFGWGWDLIGAAGAAWTPFLSRTVPALQTAVLIVGLAWAIRTSRRIAGERRGEQTAPVVLSHLTITIGLLWLLVG